jgi:hypothetical protein
VNRALIIPAHFLIAGIAVISTACEGGSVTHRVFPPSPASVTTRVGAPATGARRLTALVQAVVTPPCPAVVFRTASQQSLSPPASGLSRQADGSFTLITYDLNPVQLASQTPDFQQNFLACSGHTSGPVVPPANWSLLGDPLVGTMARDPAGARLGSSAQSGLGVCLAICSSNQSLMRAGVGNFSGSLLSSSSYTVTA